MKITREQIAVMNIQYKYHPFTKFLNDAVKYQVKNIEIWGAAPHIHLEDLTYMDIRRIKREIDLRKLKVVCYTPEQCVYPINIAADNRDERRRSLKFFENHLRSASELGADKMLVTSGWGYFDGSNQKDAWKYAAEGLFDLAECGTHHNIKIALEVLRKDESNLVNDLNSLTEMLNELNHDQIGGVLDTCPMNLAGESPQNYLEALGEKIIHVHFIDGAPQGHLAWGDGILNMEQYLQELSNGGYQGYLSLEITDSRYYMEPEKSIQKSIERLYSVLT